MDIFQSGKELNNHARKSLLLGDLNQLPLLRVFFLHFKMSKKMFALYTKAIFIQTVSLLALITGTSNHLVNRLFQNIIICVNYVPIPPMM